MLVYKHCTPGRLELEAQKYEKEFELKYTREMRALELNESEVYKYFQQATDQ